MYKMLPPVGEPIRLGPRSDPPEFTGFHSVWTQSGTAALALAVRLAMDQRPDVARPEVLIPAHGCPDLVAAVRFAGAIPILVDIGPEDPGFDPASLEQAWTKATVAVVAVNFLGIRERVHDLAHAATTRNTWLIEDSAQWYPEPQADENEPFSPTDAVILSFGRGKPVSLLGGGCLLLNQRHTPLENPPNSTQSSAAVMLSLKLIAYNWLLRPEFYGWIARMPWLRIGETRYKPLMEIRGMETTRLRLLGANVRQYLASERWREQALSELFEIRSDLFVDFLRKLQGRSGRLLRYPVLCRSSSQRNELLQHLTALGLGATAMYGEALPGVPGTAALLEKTTAVSGARAFASRLLTLPVHGKVTHRDISRLKAAIIRF